MWYVYQHNAMFSIIYNKYHWHSISFLKIKKNIIIRSATRFSIQMSLLTKHLTSFVLLLSQFYKKKVFKNHKHNIYLGFFCIYFFLSFSAKLSDRIFFFTRYEVNSYKREKDAKHAIFALVCRYIACLYILLYKCSIL